MVRTNENAKSFDVVVFGSGVAAAASSLCLLKLGRTVALLTRPALGRTPIGETLSPRCSLILSRIGIWHQFLEQNPLHSTSVRIAWHKPYLEEQDYSFHPYGPWWHVDHAAFRTLLMSTVCAAGARIFGVRDFELRHANQNRWSLDLLSFAGDRSSVESAIIVDATGRSASIARKGGARRKLYDNLITINGVAHSRERMRPDQIFTLIESTYGGWWYSSVVSDRTMVGTFVTDGPLPRQSLESHWKTQLTKSQFTRSRFTDSPEATTAYCLSAATMRTVPVATPTLFTVGDAAMTYDPLSSQGIQKALFSGYLAGVAIHDTLNGRAAAASEYSRKLEADFEKYLRIRSHYYSKVDRFLGSPFWSRRSERAPH